MPITVSGLFHYPVKSCRGIALSEATLDARGIVNDRAYLVVDDDGIFMTQRHTPRMALIEPRIDGDSLTLTAPDVSPVTVGPSTASSATRQVVIWHDTCAAVDQGDEVAAWLSEMLSVSCRLVKMADDFARRLDPDYAVTENDQTGFADAYPLLLANESSLANLNGRMGITLPMNRFRPNIVVANAAPFEEDTWRGIRIGNVDATVVKPCKRCAITTTDQMTGERGIEPLRTLATFRTLPTGGVTFAQNVIHSGPGTIRTGDEITFPA